MSKAKASRTLFLLLTGSASLFAASSGSVLATEQGIPGQVVINDPSAGVPSGTPPGARPLPRQGFESTGQDPAKYNPQEKEAAAVVNQWIGRLDARDEVGTMELLSDNILVRAGPLSSMRHGRPSFCSSFLPGFPERPGNYHLEQLYVVGGKWETFVLAARTDLNGPPGYEGSMGGYQVPVGIFLRVQNGKIIEWEDMPTGAVARPPPDLLARLRTRRGPPQVLPFCMRYSSPSPPASSRDTDFATAHLPYLYETEKPEAYFEPSEESAAQTVRAWFGTWQSGDPLLLGAFINENVTFRAEPDDPLGHGRDSLLRQICSYIGGKRKLIDLFVYGGSGDTGVLTRWDEIGRRGAVTHMASFFRVDDGLITEWDNSPLDAPPPAGGPAGDRNSAACQAVNAALGPPATGPNG